MTTTPAPQTQIRILFVDDELLILQALKRMLRREGFELFFTSDPVSASRLVGEHNIDIVVTDHNMPEMNGVEVLGLCRRLHSRTMRIMMTGQADRRETIRAINEGSIHRFLEKPWDEVELKRTLHEAARRILVERQGPRGPAEVTAPRRTTIIRDATGAIVIDARTLDSQ
jgi:response regulator RpfG family c-di-GMP phosphodiesterase